jgi:L-threonylcarbamoyladenylate synthase
VDIRTAVHIMQNSGVIAFPTETVYGLGAVATDSKAIQKVFEAKNRPSDNPLICHFYSIDQIKQYGLKMSEIELILFKHFAPGPCSILLDLPLESPLQAATAGQPKIICRIPDHPVALELIKQLSCPIVGPSANTSGRPSCTSPEMVIRDLGQKIDGVLDGFEANIGIESSILSVNGRQVKILRPGTVGFPEISEISNIYNLNLSIISYQKNPTQLNLHTTPGAKYPHYSPRTPVIQINSISEIPMYRDYTVIASHESLIKYDLRPNLESNVNLLDLGSKNSLESISHNLYNNLASIDNKNTQTAYLIIEDWGDSSIGIAIANRLEKVGYKAQSNKHQLSNSQTI